MVAGMQPNFNGEYFVVRTHPGVGAIAAASPFFVPFVRQAGRRCGDRPYAGITLSVVGWPQDDVALFGLAFKP